MATGAEGFKESGDSYYRGKNYSAAVTAYTQAIELEPSSATLYTNRAAAKLMLLKYNEVGQVKICIVCPFADFSPFEPASHFLFPCFPSSLTKQI